MMGRKAGNSSDSKASGPKQGKPEEVTKGPKRQHKKPPTPAVSSSVKKKSVKSKPGFTLYSSNSRVDGGQKTNNSERTVGLSGGERKQHGSKAEMARVADTEIVSQVQLQEERTKSALASSLYVPTADPEDSLSGAENEDIIVSTPFNKRLVSSTPDPEKLREAELEEQPQTIVENTVSSTPSGPLQPFDDTPQMIPERDVVTIKPSTLYSSAKNLARFQPELIQVAQSVLSDEKKQPLGTQEKPNDSAHINQASVASQVKSAPPWKQRHQQWRQELQQYKKNPTTDQTASERANGEVLYSKVMHLSAPAFMPPVTKAEWVSDINSAQNSEKNSSKPPASIENLRMETVCQNSALIEGSGPKGAFTGNKVILSTEQDVSNNLTLKPVFSSSGTNELYPLFSPSDVTSFHGFQKPASSPDHYKDYELFKSGILQGRNYSHSETMTVGFNAENSRPFDAMQMVSFHPNTASTYSAHCQPATVASIYTLTTTTVSKSSNNTDACETVAGSDPLSTAKIPRKIAPKLSKPVTKTDPKVNSLQNDNNTFRNTKDKGSAAAAEDGKLLKMPQAPTKDSGPLKIPTAEVLECSDQNNSTENTNTNNLLIWENHMSSQEQDKNTKGSESRHNTSYLSEVINLLKTNGFNAQPRETVSAQVDDSKSELSSNYDIAEQGEPQKILETAVSSSSDAGLRKIMSLYIPLDWKQTHGEKSDTVAMELADKETDGNTMNKSLPQDVNNSSSAILEKGDSNQNYNSDDSGYDVPRRRQRSHNLYYLESMADGTLRDIACRLAFKATALRDVELRDLIDDMIFHTDAVLGHEDARYQSSHLFFQEENTKLKKRLYNVNKQLDAKERQEKRAMTSIYSVTNNELLHLERKIVYLQEEKDKLDTQVTTLLEEKSKWLITQQELVKTISLKDHEILKLEEKHQQERIKLHQSLDQATQNSSGVHYKLSVADREISNMEQRLKCRDLDIADLREKLHQAELSVGDCKQQVTAKDQEILRLQDMVDTLKIGVDHVLQMFESASPTLTTTEQQRQGIDSLYRMAHPERFAVNAASPAERREPASASQQYQPRAAPETISQQSAFTPSSPHARTLSSITAPDAATQTPAHLAARELPVRPEPRYPEPSSAWMHSRLQRLNEDRGQGQGGRVLPERQKHTEAIAGNRLTAATLEKHNQRLSPIDRRLWRSMRDSPVEVAMEPYYSDSEVELNPRESRRVRRRSPKSILKQRRPTKVWAEPVSFRDRYDEDRYREESRRRESSGWGKKGRVRRKSESDKYTGSRSSYRDLPESYVDRRPRIRSATGRGRKSNRSWHEDFYDDRDDSRQSMSNYFFKYSNMPRLPKSPQGKQRDDSLRDTGRDRAHKVSQSTKYSSLHSVPISTPSDNWGNNVGRKSTPRQRSLSPYQDEDLVEMDIESSSHSSSDLNFTNVDLSRHEREGSRDRQAWSAARSFSPSSMRKTQYARKKERRSRSLENPSYGLRHPEQVIDETPSSEEQSVLLRTLEPERSISPQKRQGRGQIYASGKQKHFFSSSDPGQESKSGSRSDQHQKNHLDADNGQSNGEMTRGHPSHYATRGSNFPTQSSPRHLSDISISRRATGGEDITQRDFFQGTELSSSMSSIEDENCCALQSTNNNQMKSLNEDPFSTGIASLDLKIASLQKKIDRAKAIFS